MGALYQGNLRGLSSPRLVAEWILVEEQVADWKAIYDAVGVPYYELESALFYLGYIKAELARRESCAQRAQADARQVELRALKELASQDVVDIVGHYVDVVVEGGKYKFLCPVHGDNDPSGVFYPDGTWWCFGCNKGGDVFDALMFLGRLTFGESVSLLRRYYGLGRRGNGDTK